MALLAWLSPTWKRLTVEVTIVAWHQIVPRRSMMIGVRSLPSQSMPSLSKVGINIELDWLMSVTVFEQSPQNNGITGQKIAKFRYIIERETLSKTLHHRSSASKRRVNRSMQIRIFFFIKYNPSIRQHFFQIRNHNHIRKQKCKSSNWNW